MCFLIPAAAAVADEATQKIPPSRAPDGFVMQSAGAVILLALRSTPP